MKRLFFLIILFSSFGLSLSAQEICNDGIDNVGDDGIFDCGDISCSSQPGCDNTYIGNDASCNLVLPPAPKFTMKLKYASPDETVNHLGRVVVGDLDRDGIPEMVTTEKFGQNIFILDGKTGAIEKKLNTSFAPGYEDIAIANIDNDSCAEIFIIDSDWKLYSYDCNLTLIWGPVQLPGDVGMMGLADFGSDGLVELYVRNAIYDAKNGVQIVKNTGSWSNTNGGPVAVDMNLDKKLDLVVGCTIYDVNLGTRTVNSGTLTVQNSTSLFPALPQYFTRFAASSTSVADFNFDGYLEVVTSGSTESGKRLDPSDPKGVATFPQNTTIFLWDPHNNTVKTFFEVPSPLPSWVTDPKNYANGWIQGTGRINIADLDGDGKLDLSYVTGSFLYALDENLKKKPWAPITVNEETSGFTGCTLYDFNNDGQSEIVYRDEQFLYIINGQNGVPYPKQNCISRTNREYPIVVDVDANGSTEICVTCRQDDSRVNIGDIKESRYSHVRVFESGNPKEPWVPARRLWNQHGYFNANVTDRLTIPKNPMRQSTLFSVAPCKFGDPPVARRPLNSFLNQSPYIDTKGCPQFVAANLGFLGTITPPKPVCPAKDFDITFTMNNTGDLPVNGAFPISFYNGNPEKPEGIYLNTEIKTLTDFKKGDVTTITLPVHSDGKKFELFIVLNDDGKSSPPIDYSNTSHSSIIDCPGNNITQVSILPDPAPIDVRIKPNFQCAGSTAPANGTASATVEIDGKKDSTSFTFYWGNGNTVTPPAGFKGAMYAGLAGTYTVTAIHDAAKCNAATKTIEVPTQADSLPKLTPQVVQDNTKCVLPGNGKADVIVKEKGVVSPPSNYTFKWYEGTDAFTGKVVSLKHDANDLTSKTYTVEVTNLTTGCSNAKPLIIGDNTPKLVPTVSIINIDCTPAALGELHVQSLINTRDNSSVADLGKYIYNWYKGNAVKPLIDFAGIDNTGKPDGPYTLVVEDPISLCKSAPFSAVITKKLPPQIINITTEEQTSCNNSFNGKATVIVDVNDDYTYEWFKGQNTTTPVIGTDRILPSQNVGMYTVRVTHKITKCSSTGEAEIKNGIVPLDVAPDPKAISFCNPKNGRIDISVSPIVPNAVYRYFMDDGTTIKDQLSNAFTGLDIGTYTVWAKDENTSCETKARPATVVDGITPITAIDTITNATTCFGQGSIQVDVTSPSTNGFKFEWFNGGDTSDPIKAIATHPSKRNTATASGIAGPKGNYTVKITDLFTLCSTEFNYNIIFINDPKLTLTKEDIKKCDNLPGGKIISLLEPVNVSVLNYTLLIYKSSVDPDPGITSNGTLPYRQISTTASESTYTATTFDPGFYTVVSVDISSGSEQGCRVPRTIKLDRVTSNPIVSSTVTSNSLCGGVGNGKIELFPGPYNDLTFYNYKWIPLVSGNQTALNLLSGLYDVTVEFNASAPDFEGCETTKQIFVPNNPQVIKLPPMQPTDIQNCNPLNGFQFVSEGKAEVVGSITDNGSLVSPAIPPYSFQWLDDGGTQIGLDVNPKDNLPIGKYLVKVTNTTTGCSQTQGFTIGTKPLNVGVKLKSFQEQLHCTKLDKGYLEVEPDPAAPATTYSYQWYSAGTKDSPINPVFTGLGDLTGNTLPASPQLLGGLLLDQKVGVRIQNDANKCWATDIFTMTERLIPMRIIAYSSPLINCTNGALLTNEDVQFKAEPIAPDDGTILNFQYRWIFDNVDPKYLVQNPTAPKAHYQNVNSITVQAVDLTDPDVRCKSNTVAVTIDSTRVPINAVAEELLPVRNCNPNEPNGVATAYVLNGDVRDISNYVFDWVEGNFPPASTPLISVGSQTQMDGLKGLTIYTAKATSRVTGCFSRDTVLIHAKPKGVGDVNIAVLSNQTNCLDVLPDGRQLQPNGSLQVVIDRPSDYTFTWTNEDDSPLILTPPPSQNSTLVEGLSNGIYKVIVVDKASLCLAIGQDTVGINQIIPDFTFETKASVCNEDNQNVDNGSATLFVVNSVEIDSIWWDPTPFTQSVNGNILAGVPKGTYYANILTRNGCINKLPVTINTEIHDYNFISRNGDELNSHFHIGCIESFLNNNVKIFNRAGTLVYEANYYDNAITFFNGTSNRGVNLMGNALPSGTYFYIIDKRDGSKQIAGYLEIVD